MESKPITQATQTQNNIYVGFKKCENMYKNPLILTVCSAQRGNSFVQVKFCFHKIIQQTAKSLLTRLELKVNKI